ncbi:ABC-2 type transport system permease protein [Paenibacillus endophyticus]|uniref:ABC-2 type transport system permease protein n=1 Tax=Paenibacillus endophyticus TaxID=1294268 RepID=A0A7W5CDA6_9BACL|nr:ABC transporter permease [Paenibacillus endophyticus]MBB3155085.1 ABC-2 type transport system permease protein [Paenibacillus endophyticus]
MRDTLWLIRKTFMSTFKNYLNLFIYFVFPVMGILLATLVQGGTGDSELKMGIVNHDGGQAITKRMMDSVGKQDSMLVIELEENEIKGRIASGELDAAIIFPTGFAQSLIAHKPADVKIVSIKGAQVTGQVTATLDQHINNMVSVGRAAQGDEAKFIALYDKFQKPGFELAGKKVEDQSVNFNKTNQSIGYLLILMLVSASNLSGILIKERENRTYYRLLSSPISPRTYVLSNIIVNLTMMMLQIAVTLLIMMTIFHVDPGIPYWSMFLILVLFALVAIGLSLVIVAFSSSSSTASGMQNMILIPTSLLSGCMFPLVLMPETMQQLARFLPQYWLLDTFSDLQQGGSFGELSLNLIILIAFSVVFTLIAVYKFGRNNDTRSYI